MTFSPFNFAETLETPTINAAFKYAGIGWAVFPLHGKLPFDKGGFHNATTDQDEVLQRWGHRTDANIGIATGKASGFWVLDIDGPEGDNSLAELEVDYGFLPETLRQTTGKGTHFIFTMPELPDGEKLGNRAGLRPGIDVRGDGGYIVACPSIHPNTGKKYRWDDTSAMPIPAPQWLVDLVVKQEASAPTPAPEKRLDHGSPSTPYGQVALDDECNKVRSAPWGKQEETVNKAALKIGGLVAGGELEHYKALNALMNAALQMTSEPGKSAWTQAELRKKVETGFKDGTPRAAKQADTSVFDTLPQPLTVLPLSSFAESTPPPREWIVTGLVPKGFVTLLSGPGGTGKSLLGLMLQVAGAANDHFLHRETKAFRTLGFYGEEDRAELERRTEKVCAGLGISRAKPETAFSVPLHGRDAVLATWDGKAMVPTSVYTEFERATEQYKPECIILDNIARLFSGNENDRMQVTQFVTLLEAWAIKYQCGVILMGHPSKAGAQYSGSTAWEGSVRSRLFFGRPEVDADVDEALVQDKRILSVGKANMGPSGTEILMDWVDGCFIADVSEFHDGGPLERLHDQAAKNKAENVFLACLEALAKQGRSASEKSRSDRYAPKQMAKMQEAQGLRRKELENAMERLFSAGKIEVGVVGRDGSRNKVNGIVKTSMLKPASERYPHDT